MHHHTIHELRTKSHALEGYPCRLQGRLPSRPKPRHCGHARRAYNDANSGSDEICPSGGYQFGYDDDACGVTHEQWRKEWIAKGMPWFSSGRKPPQGWDTKQRLLRIGVLV